MKGILKRGLLGSLALVIVFAVSAASAQAITIHPDNTAVSGTARNPVLTYNGITVNCDTGTASGRTGASVANVSLSLTFSGNCRISGVGAATVTCRGLVTLIATTADGRGGGNGTVSLDTGFDCTIAAVGGLCRISVVGPQARLANRGTGLTAATTQLDMNVAVAATSNSVLCGGTRGTATFAGTYSVTPTTLTITNP